MTKCAPNAHSCKSQVDGAKQASPVQPAPAAAPAVGGAAILARLRAQREAKAAAAAPAAADTPAAEAAAAPASEPPAAAGPPAATGGAAILARLRAQRGAKAEPAAAAPTKQLVVLYASQTGTAQEIAKNIQAAAEQKGMQGRVSWGTAARGGRRAAPTWRFPTVSPSLSLPAACLTRWPP